MLHYQIIPVTHYQQNCTLLWCDQTRDAAVVDPGGDVERILAEAAALDVKLSQILLTHGHLDHVGATAALVKRLGLPVIGPHADDLFWINLLPQQAQMMGFVPVEGFVPTRLLNHNDRVKVGNTELKVLHCPGHTPGHVIFFDPESRLAQVGDVLFKGSIGRTDFPRGNHQDLLNSIRERVFPLGDDVRFIPGHGPMSTFGHERATNPFVADKNFG
ncbi:MBL fold metallo-hydrolase [Cellvibrio sp. KY-GH-1]|uniref:MBL fold metallo-hydrolase n=1 Tax=Cellvibrio sp. KY-GH-1 TaxID=2303332 RepID=UPI001246F918|nr:MBL fold metallo-hydrolase [Cellvibrio sp. KY-GH-1]QEY18086.1 MBL fold metallo-hydrolase [Cellvibrio sp. KY-GH-1]